MSRFRKKPVEIEAVRFDGMAQVDDTPEMMFDGSFEQPDWLSEATAKREGEPGSVYPSGYGPNESLFIETLEGTHRADVGDYIIRGVKGELYPCKPDIFAMTYDPVGAGT